MDPTILQWNCRGLKSNLHELQVLIQQNNPLIISLQETFQNQSKEIKLKHYTGYHKYARYSNEKPHGGTSMYIKNSIPQREIDLITNL